MTQNAPRQKPQRPASRVRPSVWLIVFSFVVLVAFLVVMLGAYLLWAPVPPSGNVFTASTPRVPIPQRDTQQAQLNNLGWVNKASGIAHIPVDEAMKMIATQGVSTLAPVPTSSTPQPQGTGQAQSPGAALFQQLGCGACHMAADSPLAPTLNGIYGIAVKLSDGSTVTADDAYIKESILDPKAKVVNGFQPIMPSFSGRVSDTQIQDLIDYIKSLAVKK